MMVYMPYWYRSELTGGLVVRTQQDSTSMADAIRKTVWSVNPGVSVPTVRSLGGVVADSVANRRFEKDLLSLFAVSALLLAGLGVYGVVTYSVVQRQREIGVRVALGAQKTNIYRLVLRDGLTPVLIGTVVGIGVAFAFFARNRKPPVRRKPLQSLRRRRCNLRAGSCRSDRMPAPGGAGRGSRAD